MSDVILVLDAGSSSLKFAVFAVAEPPPDQRVSLVHGQVESLGVAPRFSASGADQWVLAQSERDERQGACGG